MNKKLYTKIDISNLCNAPFEIKIDFEIDENNNIICAYANKIDVNLIPKKFRGKNSKEFIFAKYLNNCFISYYKEYFEKEIFLNANIIG